MGEVTGCWLFARLQQLGVSADLSTIRTASEATALQHQMLHLQIITGA